MKLLILTLFLIFLSCNINAQIDDYTFGWSPNIEPDIKAYDLYLWTGGDTLSSPFVENTYPDDYKDFYIGTANHPDTMLHFSSVADGITYIQGAICARDSVGNKSMIATSAFYLSKDKLAPEKPTYLEVQF
jgi:hypothetical protein